MLDKLREQNKVWDDVSRAAQKDDKVIIDFKGTRDGKAIASAAADNFDLELGSNHLIAGFEEGIVGHTVGEEFTLNLKKDDMLTPSMH